MSHSYCCNRIHLIFSTKDRQKRIPSDLQPKLWAYVAGIAHNHGFEAVKVGGSDDDVHVLLSLPATMPLAKAIQFLKGASSKWLNDTGRQPFAWQEGYGAFGVSASQTDAVITYIDNQPVHHATRNFEDEFLAFLRKYGVPYDPKYVLG
jgi:putative transposase